MATQAGPSPRRYAEIAGAAIRQFGGTSMYILLIHQSGSTRHQIATHARQALILLQSDDLVGCDVTIIDLDAKETSIDQLLAAADREETVSW